MQNDELILDCCMFHIRHRARTVLCSNDKNLCVLANTEGIKECFVFMRCKWASNYHHWILTGIHTISPSQYWSSQEVASQIFGEGLELSRFGKYKESYRDKLSSHHAERDISGQGYDDDGDIMMVDEIEEEPTVTEGPGAIFKSEDPLNMLHEAIVDHFGRLLTELVGRVIEPELRAKPTPREIASMSRYDPRRRHYSEWSTLECLDWLADKLMKVRDGVDIRPMIKNSRAGDFLQKPYRNLRGARTGKEWTKADWDKTMRHLQIIGEMFSEMSILESLYHLEPHIDHEFGII